MPVYDKKPDPSKMSIREFQDYRTRPGRNIPASKGASEGFKRSIEIVAGKYPVEGPSRRDVTLPVEKKSLRSRAISKR